MKDPCGPVFCAAFATLVLGCTAAGPTPHPSPSVPLVSELCLEGPASERAQEFSGLAWHGDTLLLLPQWKPSRAGERKQLEIYTIPKATLLAHLDGRDTAPIHPGTIVFDISAITPPPNLQGFEALDFNGDRGVVIAESGKDDTMAGHAYAATFQADGALKLSATALNLTVPIHSDNHAFEALTHTPDGWLALFEINGADPNCHPTAWAWTDGAAPHAVAMPPIPYRVSDATELDAEGRFWVTQYSYRSQKDNSECERTIQGHACAFGEPVSCDTHGEEMFSLERLVELRYTQGRVESTGQRIDLSRIPRPRNWEGIARLDDRGFVIVTDEWPRTILAFVPRPGAPPVALTACAPHP